MVIDPLPPPVKVGAGRVFTFRHSDDLEGAVGLCEFHTHTCHIAPGQLPVEEVDTVIHELFHAILYAQGREYAGKTEETYVRALATGFAGVLKDNPKFLNWLSHRLKNQ